jgi:hypothetical protein
MQCPQPIIVAPSSAKPKRKETIMTNAARKLNPAGIAAAAEFAQKRTKTAGGQDLDAAHWQFAAGFDIANVMADPLPEPIESEPDVSDPLPDAASAGTQPIAPSPHQEAPWASGHVALEPYQPTDAITAAVREIVTLHRLRQGMIKAQTKLILQAKASVRFATQSDDDFASDEAKAAARKRNDDLYSVLKKDPSHPLHANLMPYHAALDPLDLQRAIYEKEMVRQVKTLPVYAWVKSVKGFGDVSFATLVGECGDIGGFNSVSAVWKRLGLAVMGGNRQGAPGKDATADDWIAHGYNAKRRSVSYCAREHVIGGMGKWRPTFGEDVWANPLLTYYQQVFADRARVEAVKLDMPVTQSAKGCDSYKKHVSMRAHRYVEKRLIKHLYIEWRRA